MQDFIIKQYNTKLVYNKARRDHPLAKAIDAKSSAVSKSRKKQETKIKKSEQLLNKAKIHFERAGQTAVDHMPRFFDELESVTAGGDWDIDLTESIARNYNQIRLRALFSRARNANEDSREIFQTELDELFASFRLMSEYDDEYIKSERQRFNELYGADHGKALPEIGVPAVAIPAVEPVDRFKYTDAYFLALNAYTQAWG